MRGQRHTTFIAGASSPVSAPADPGSHARFSLTKHGPFGSAFPRRSGWQRSRRTNASSAPPPFSSATGSAEGPDRALECGPTRGPHQARPRRACDQGRTGSPNGDHRLPQRDLSLGLSLLFGTASGNHVINRQRVGKQQTRRCLENSHPDLLERLDEQALDDFLVIQTVSIINQDSADSKTSNCQEQSGELASLRQGQWVVKFHGRAFAIEEPPLHVQTVLSGIRPHAVQLVVEQAILHRTGWHPLVLRGVCEA